jgi:hypothetical protein
MMAIRLNIPVEEMTAAGEVLLCCLNIWDLVFNVSSGKATPMPMTPATLPATRLAKVLSPPPRGMGHPKQELYKQNIIKRKGLQKVAWF